MKKAFLLFILLTTSLFLKAQLYLDSLDEKKKKKLDPRLTVRAHFNFSSIGGESESYQGLLPGAQVGVGTPVAKLSRNMAVFAEVMYSMQGGKYEESGYTDPGPGGGGAYNYSGKVRLNYINVPITARFQSPGGFYAEAGVQPGVLVSAKDKIGSNSYDYKDHVNKFNFSGVVGAGYQVNDHLGIGARATPGITNINKKGSGYGSTTNKDRNFVVSVGAHYIL